MFRLRPPIRAQSMRISLNFLSAEDDLKVLRAGMRMAVDVGRQTPLAPFVANEEYPA